jgi:uncharacterized membrane protein YkoI
MQKKTIWITAAAAGAVLILGGTGIAYAATDGFEQDDDSRETTVVESNSSDDATDTDGPATPVAEGWLEKASAAALEAAGGGTVTDADVSDDADHAYSVDVRREDGTEVDVELDSSFAVVRLDEDTADAAEPLDAEDAPISAADRAAAEKAALAATNKGTVTDVERSDDRDHAWEVEVTFANGTDVDVELTESFTLVRIDK